MKTTMTNFTINRLSAVMMGVALWLGGAVGCSDDPKVPTNQCALKADSCPNACASGVGIMGESCGAPSDCQCGLFCDEGRCMPYRGDFAGCVCADGEAPDFPDIVTTCTASTAGALCEDTNPCTGTGTCDDQGQCVTSPIGFAAACDDDNPCTTRDTCAGAVCLGEERPDGSVCDDGDLCTVGDACIQGQCTTGEPLDCSDQEDDCNTSACDPSSGMCMPTAREDGTACDDGSLCTQDDACQQGTCEGQALDCSDAGDQCNPAACDEETGLCVATPAEDGTACEDGDLCTLEDTCQEGVCGSGFTQACDDDPCVVATCNPENGQCEGPPVEDGTACNDDNACTEIDTCQEGVCVGERDLCACDGQADGAACDDFNPCTATDSCQDGACVGEDTLDCSDLNDPCNVGFCDPETGQCAVTPVLPGTPCDDGDLCTQQDACFNGECVGEVLDCSGLDTLCQQGVCDPQTGECATAAEEDGTACNNGDECIIGEVCEGGTCSGGVNQCSVCAALPVGAECDDEDPCTLNDICVQGEGGKLCAGQALDCSELDQGCMVGRCDPQTVECVQEAATNGTACDDANDCTTGDFCSDGVCQGLDFPVCGEQAQRCEPFAPIDTIESSELLELEDGELLVRGRVEVPGESDWYVVELEEGQLFSVETGPDCESVLDTFISVRLGDGETVLDVNDDFEGSFWATLQDVVIPSTGLYFVQVRSFVDGAEESSYLLRLTARQPPGCVEDAECGCELLTCNGDAQNPGACVAGFPEEVEPNNSAQAPGAVALDSEVGGELEVATDEDWFAVELPADVPLNITTDTFCGTPVDTELRLFEANGTTELFFNDDAPQSVLSALEEVTVPQAGTYLLQVKGHNNAVGPYRLQVADARCTVDDDCGCPDLRCDVEAGRVCVPRAVETEPNNGLAQAMTLTLDSPITGRIDAPREVDYYAVSLAPGIYTVQTRGLCEGGGDTQIQLLDAQENMVASDDDDGPGRFSLIDGVEITEPGRYYVRVNYFGLSQGDYVVSVVPGRAP